MLRAHGTDTPREPWRFGDAGEPFYEALTESIALRGRLLPYLYALAAEAHFDGQPLLRHLAFHSPKDPRAVEVRDQFLLGPALMIAPVLEPQAYGPDSTPLDNRDPSREVYLPRQVAAQGRYGEAAVSLPTPAPIPGHAGSIPSP